ncbi:hypothetical protein BB560_001351 [Smittium megazygosporum]|uniref:Replication factor A protein 3 n=1 Tax=Smittium megazygosporum TaxID=133381 RepID=A0A2T9ZHW1_9FUNG|nr:hypothetical protein BB560_001351 [Smittium megazygosporum]
MEKPTPRINSSLLPKYVDTTVRIVGKVQEHRGTSVILQASDKKPVTVELSPDCQIASEYVEIIGKVQNDLKVSGYSSIPLSENFDLDAYNGLVLASNSNPTIFT